MVEPAVEVGAARSGESGGQAACSAGNDCASPPGSCLGPPRQRRFAAAWPARTIKAGQGGRDDHLKALALAIFYPPCRKAECWVSTAKASAAA